MSQSVLYSPGGALERAGDAREQARELAAVRSAQALRGVAQELPAGTELEQEVHACGGEKGLSALDITSRTVPNTLHCFLVRGRFIDLEVPRGTSRTLNS